MPGVTVALPISRASPHLQDAARSILTQTHRELELLCILNGADDFTRAAIQRIARADRRVRIIELPDANLARALNAALGLAAHELVARMDADDLSHPERIARQVEHMRAEPDLVALGCAFETMDAASATIARMTPPTDPRAIRRQLLLENVFAHGSMMLRRSPVLDAGGYDERAIRAQDYELWLRLSRLGYSLANLSDSLYRYRTLSAPKPGAPWLSTPDQARVAAQAMLAAWHALPAGDISAITPAIAEALSGAIAPADAARAIEQCMEEGGPSREGLIALLWSHWLGGAARQQSFDAARAALLRETGARLRARGARSLWLMGAGAHTSWLLEHRHHLGLLILGVIDDRAAGRIVAEFQAQPQSAASPREHVLISSDAHEDVLWSAAEPLRTRGVIVTRLYESAPPIAHSLEQEDAA